MLRRPAIRQMFLPRHRAARLTWRKRHLRCRRQNVASILFTDEYRREEERCADTCVMQHRPFGEGSLMVWEGITEPWHDTISCCRRTSGRNTLQG